MGGSRSKAANSRVYCEAPQGIAIALVDLDTRLMTAGAVTGRNRPFRRVCDGTSCPILPLVQRTSKDARVAWLD